MYVAVKGGERAILGSYALLSEQRRGDRDDHHREQDRGAEDDALAADRARPGALAWRAQ